MTPQQIVAMAARLFAIWLVVIAIQLFVIANALGTNLGESGGFAFYFLPCLPLVVAIFLWFSPMSIANKLVARTHDTNSIRMPAREVTAAASAIIGIWVLIAAIPQFLGKAGMILVTGETRWIEMFFTPEHNVQLFALLAQCLLALFLVFKPWSIARMVFPHSNNADRSSE